MAVQVLPLTANLEPHPQQKNGAALCRKGEVSSAYPCPTQNPPDVVVFVRCTRQQQALPQLSQRVSRHLPAPCRVPAGQRAQREACVGQRLPPRCCGRFAHRAVAVGGEPCLLTQQGQSRGHRVNEVAGAAGVDAGGNPHDRLLVRAVAPSTGQQRALAAVSTFLQPAGFGEMQRGI